VGEEDSRHTFRSWTGYIEGKTSSSSGIRSLVGTTAPKRSARTVVGSRPDLILAMTGALTRAIKPLTANIPILALTADPVAGGIVTNMAKPGGNITGVSTDAGLEVYSKRLQFLVETARRLANVRFLVTTTSRWLWETKAGDARMS